MELKPLLEARRSTRHFDVSRDVSDEVLGPILRAPLAMPHACNTYDWRAVVLRRRDRDAARWPRVFEALYGQGYVAEAPVVIVWAVQPRWFAARHRENVAELVKGGLLDPERAGDLLEVLSGAADLDLGAGDAPGSATAALTGGLIGEAMMGVGAAMLAALDAGLGATVTACRPGAMAQALDLPPDAVIAPFGVLALGYAAAEKASAVPAGAGVAAAKPLIEEMYFDGLWGKPLSLD